MHDRMKLDEVWLMSSFTLRNKCTGDCILYIDHEILYEFVLVSFNLIKKYQYFFFTYENDSRNEMMIILLNWWRKKFI